MMSQCSSICGLPSAIVALKSVRCTVISGYSCTSSVNTSPTVTLTASSSMHSLTSACCPVSPFSTLPPTNSHSRPLALCAGLRQIMNLPFSHMSAAATSVTFIIPYTSAQVTYQFSY